MMRKTTEELNWNSTKYLFNVKAGTEKEQKKSYRKLIAK